MDLTTDFGAGALPHFFRLEPPLVIIYFAVLKVCRLVYYANNVWFRVRRFCSLIQEPECRCS
jgi:hypothetical protein